MQINIYKKKLYILFLGLVIVTTSILLVRSYDPVQGWHPSSQIDFSQGLNVNSVQIQGTAGRNWFYDSESTSRRLRVGNVWSKSGIYAEDGDLALGASSGKIYLGGTRIFETSQSVSKTTGFGCQDGTQIWDTGIYGIVNSYTWDAGGVGSQRTSVIVSSSPLQHTSTLGNNEGSRLFSGRETIKVEVVCGVDKDWVDSMTISYLPLPEGW